MKITDLHAPFSTADADLIGINFSENHLVLTLNDWQENKHIIDFQGVIAFRWSEDDFAKFVIEQVSLVEDSTWIKELVERHKKPLDVIEYTYSEEQWHSYHDVKKLKHYIVTINAVGTLEVVSENISFT